jgi:acyl-coenzyme A synthetase/AMP-(fatty) acid ligase
MLPSFHTMGFCFQLLFPLYTGRPVALFEPQFPNLPVLPSPAVVLDAMRRSQATAACLIPAFLEVFHLASTIVALF